MSSTCRRFAFHDAGDLQRIGEGTFAGTRGNDKVAPKRSSAEADHTLLQGSTAGFSRVLPGPTYSAARRKNRNDSGITKPLILFAMDLRLDLLIYNSLNLRDRMA